MNKSNTARNGPPTLHEVAAMRLKMLRALYRYKKSVRRLDNVTHKTLDAFFGSLVGISARSAQNVRIGQRNLNLEKAAKLKKSLGTASVEIDPYVFTIQVYEENYANEGTHKNS